MVMGKILEVMPLKALEELRVIKREEMNLYTDEYPRIVNRNSKIDLEVMDTEPLKAIVDHIAQLLKERVAIRERLIVLNKEKSRKLEKGRKEYERVKKKGGINNEYD